MKQYALIGFPLSHSFSKTFFENKFKEENRNDCTYSSCELPDIHLLPDWIKKNPLLRGFNVTIPYKEAILPYLHELSDEAAEIGAVNCVSIENGYLKGYNTDAYGFSTSLKPFLEKHHTHALIFGTGGASKAVQYSLKKLSISFYTVSRKPHDKHTLSYEEINEKMLQHITLLINASPVGMYPNTQEKPLIPYQALNTSHLLYDLVYNPEKTAFLQAGEKQGATCINGLNMLHLQAEKSWEIWKKSALV